MPRGMRGFWLLCVSSALLSGCDDLGPESRTRASDHQLTLSHVRLADERNPELVSQGAPDEDQCSQLDAAVRQLSNMTANTFRIEAGTIRAPDEMWVKLSPDQQQQIMGFAAQMSRCENGSGEVTVRELTSGTVLARMKAPQ